MGTEIKKVKRKYTPRYKRAKKEEQPSDAELDKRIAGYVEETRKWLESFDPFEEEKSDYSGEK